MSDFIITSDDTTDLTEEYCKERDLYLIPMSYIINGKNYKGDDRLTPKKFYDKIREGAMPTTSQINPDEGKEALRPFAAAGHNIIHIAFSSGLSGTCQSMRLAAEDLMEEYPEIRIYVVDSLCAALGEGLLVHKALDLRDQGCTMDEIIEWIESNKMNVCHNFTVDDLFHLQRGGRVSKTAAVIGTMVNIKPLLHVDDEGRLITIGKVRGRKKSLLWLVDHMEEQMKGFEKENDVVFISHADCPEDAEFVKNQIISRFGITNIMIGYIGPVIGSHAGVGMVTLHFMGSPR